VSDFEDSLLERVIIAGSGSELHLCLEAKKLLEGRVSVRVVSMPCWDLFDRMVGKFTRAVKQS
jgi:transketolase